MESSLHQYLACPYAMASANGYANCTLLFAGYEVVGVDARLIELGLDSAYTVCFQ
ncbi:hypothetical protein GCM10008090_27470 [Arenicella chitinivorans]|uniref:Uncharacterized protein n=1 Tax=Arenicella chitinivorans TaxID=1329800 RepID=A0A918RYP9_9GAMM|nr:hypothetical protein [Arenicella chitinivorans]GHA16175.1 hypothetical protein GCM10008090_27470 [Arenicella chitinivorans]